MANIYKGTLGLIGNTPLVEVVNIEKELGLEATVLVKLEYLNPAGSVKDRIAKAMIEDAEEKGLLKPGATIIEPAKFLKEKVPLIKYHHERFDGKGYPEGLKGEEIPLLARIICCADSFDAMTSKRAYRDTMPLEFAKKEMIRCSETQFDPRIVNAFLEVIADEDKMEKLLENQQIIRTPVVRNGKQSTLGYQPDVWKKWE